MGQVNAILLLGATGTGKTPLGEHLERHGLCGRRCHHFDFGSYLRRVGEEGGTRGLEDSQVVVVQRVLSTGDLLEDHEFPIARQLLRAFLNEREAGESDIVVLNGLPRHSGQARDIEDLVAVAAVVHLSCSTEVVRERIRLNSGGDRTDRVDDSPEEVENKLRIFEKRTAPLLAYYRERGANIIDVDVEVGTAPADIATRILPCP